MKLKYKRTILFISLGVLCIGAVTFSIKEGSADKKPKKTVLKETSASPDVLPTASQDTDPVSGEVTLEKDAYSEVNAVVEKYFKARVDCDMDTLKTVVSDISSFSEEQLQDASTYIEAYKNIECYTLKGLEDGSYVVFVYSELKLTGVDTLAPGLTELYVCTNDDDNLVVYTGVMSDTQQGYLEEAEQQKSVQNLIDSIESKYKEARQKDKNLDDLIQKINNQADKEAVDTESKSE